MLVAILAAIGAGLLGFLPLFAALRLSQRNVNANMLTTATFGLVGSFVSLIVLGVLLFACSRVAHDVLVPFAVAEIAALIIITSVYVLFKNVLSKRKRGE